MWPFRRRLDNESALKGPCSDLDDLGDRMSDLADAVRLLQHEWALASEELTALKDRVHREVGYIARGKREQLPAQPETPAAPIKAPARRTPFSSRKSVGGSA